MRHLGIVAAPCFAAALLGSAVPAGEPLAAPPAEPERVTVQHVLIGFRGTVRGKEIERSKKEAEDLAREIVERARGGEDFGALVRQHTDDSFPGIYKLANKGVQPLGGEKRRYDTVTNFANLAFSLRVGEVGLAEYHPTRSPYGWHVLKRLE